MAGVPSTVQIVSGDIVMPAGNTKTVQGLAEPTNSDDAATKNYVDTMVYDEISSTEGLYEARVQTTAIPGSGTSVFGSTDGTKYSQFGTSTTGSSTISTSKSVDGAWEVESEESVSDSSSTAHRTTIVTDGANTAVQIAQITAGSVTAGSQATQGAVDAILAAISGAASGQITATVTDGVTTVGINGATTSGLDLLARGAIVPLNESGHEALPVGITSLVQGLGLLAALGGVPIEIGTWTPTGTAVSNVSSVTGNLSRYFRLGDHVLAFPVASVTPTTTGAFEIRLSPPVPSNFALSHHLSGPVTGNDLSSGRAIPDTTNDEIRIFGTRAATSGQSVFGAVLYQIVS